MLQKTLRSLRVFVFGPTPENENAESAESIAKFFLTLSLIFIDLIPILRHLEQC